MIRNALLILRTVILGILIIIAGNARVCSDRGGIIMDFVRGCRASIISRTVITVGQNRTVRNP